MTTISNVGFHRVDSDMYMNTSSTPITKSKKHSTSKISLYISDEARGEKKLIGKNAKAVPVWEVNAAELDAMPVSDSAIIVSKDSGGGIFEGYYLDFQTKSDMSSALEAVQPALKKCDTANGTGGPDELNNDSDRKGLREVKDSSMVLSSQENIPSYETFTQQQNILQDYIRVSVYHKAITHNSAMFQDKVVLDVGSGTALLSFFVAQAGASRVYAVESTVFAELSKKLVDESPYKDMIEVIQGQMESVELPEKVDVIVSEPFGYLLFNENSLKAFIGAKRYLKPGGRLLPSKACLYIAPFTNDQIYMDVVDKCNFWAQQSFYNINLSVLRDKAVDEYLRQPIVSNIGVECCLCQPCKHTIDFEKIDASYLDNMEFPLSFVSQAASVIHGIVTWFDIFLGTMENPFWLSTSPTQPPTRWYQVACLLRKPLIVKQGQKLDGTLNFRLNQRQVYDVHLRLGVSGSPAVQSTNDLDLAGAVFQMCSGY